MSKSKSPTEWLDEVLAEHDGYTLAEYKGELGGHNYSQNQNALTAKQAILNQVEAEKAKAVDDARFREAAIRADDAIGRMWRLDREKCVSWLNEQASDYYKLAPTQAKELLKGKD